MKTRSKWVVRIAIALFLVIVGLLGFGLFYGGMESPHRNFETSIVLYFAASQAEREKAGRATSPYADAELEELRTTVSRVYGVSKVIADRDSIAVTSKSMNMVLLFDIEKEGNGRFRWTCQRFSVQSGYDGSCARMAASERK
jgi:hypothetical protein